PAPAAGVDHGVRRAARGGAAPGARGGPAPAQLVADAAVRGRMRRLLLTLALVLGLAPQAQAAWHFELGIGEQQPSMFDDPRFAALGLDRVRIVTAYDVVCHPGVEQLYLDNWL